MTLPAGISLVVWVYDRFLKSLVTKSAFCAQCSVFEGSFWISLLWAVSSTIFFLYVVALDTCEDIAPGSDDIPYAMFRHLGERGVAFLLALINQI